ncbi:MAG: RagB/SusD family nutrient uptake outer membrane protein [Gemmatimonas sp.]|nr:RagB/SusD family nutrient uptake outer membrane protein [Gemmatimonas sp.]
MAWEADEDQPTGDAAVLHLGRVPWYRQNKYPGRDAPINLASGREMRLIEAESLLRSGNWEGALTLVNSLRSETGVEPRMAASSEDAWTHLKRERGIELWLEARRMYDVRRWLAEDTPGITLDILETANGVMSDSHLEEQAVCFPIPDAERETNPNIS